MTSFASASSGSASASSASASSPHHAAELETALGEATQAALEAYYSLAAEGGGRRGRSGQRRHAARTPGPGIAREAHPIRRETKWRSKEVVEMADGEWRTARRARRSDALRGPGDYGSSPEPIPPTRAGLPSARARARRGPPRGSSHRARVARVIERARIRARKSAAAAAAAESLAATRFASPGIRIRDARVAWRESRAWTCRISPEGPRPRASSRSATDAPNPTFTDATSWTRRRTASRRGTIPRGYERRCSAGAPPREGLAPGNTHPGPGPVRRRSPGRRAPGSHPRRRRRRAAPRRRARALRDAGVVVSNADGEERPRETPRERLGSANRVGPRLATSLAAIAKGRASGEEIVYVPRAVTDANANGHTGRSEGAEGAEGFEDVDFAAEAVFVGPGASRVRGGGANVAGGGGDGAASRRTGRVARGGVGRAQTTKKTVDVSGDVGGTRWIGRGRSRPRAKPTKRRRRSVTGRRRRREASARPFL